MDLALCVVWCNEHNKTSSVTISDTLFVHLHARCAWAQMDKIREYRHLATLGWNRTEQTSCGKWTNDACPGSFEFVHATALIPMMLWGLENVVLLNFWVNISKILLGLLQKMPRITVQMEFDQYKRLVLCVSLAISLQMLFSPIIAFGWNDVSRHQNEGCTWIQACASIRTNTVYWQ